MPAIDDLLFEPGGQKLIIPVDSYTLARDTDRNPINVTRPLDPDAPYGGRLVLEAADMGAGGCVLDVSAPPISHRLLARASSPANIVVQGLWVVNGTVDLDQPGWWWANAEWSYPRETWVGQVAVTTHTVTGGPTAQNGGRRVTRTGGASFTSAMVGRYLYAPGLGLGGSAKRAPTITAFIDANHVDVSYAATSGSSSATAKVGASPASGYYSRPRVFHFDGASSKAGRFLNMRFLDAATGIICSNCDGFELGGVQIDNLGDPSFDPTDVVHSDALSFASGNARNLNVHDFDFSSRISGADANNCGDTTGGRCTGQYRRGWVHDGPGVGWLMNESRARTGTGGRGHDVTLEQLAAWGMSSGQGFAVQHRNPDQGCSASRTTYQGALDDDPYVSPARSVIRELNLSQAPQSGPSWYTRHRALWPAADYLEMLGLEDPGPPAARTIATGRALVRATARAAGIVRTPTPPADPPVVPIAGLTGAGAKVQDGRTLTIDRATDLPDAVDGDVLVVVVENVQVLDVRPIAPEFGWNPYLGDGRFPVDNAAQHAEVLWRRIEPGETAWVLQADTGRLAAAFFTSGALDDDEPIGDAVPSFSTDAVTDHVAPEAAIERDGSWSLAVFLTDANTNGVDYAAAPAGWDDQGEKRPAAFFGPTARALGRVEATAGTAGPVATTVDEAVPYIAVTLVLQPPGVEEPPPPPPPPPPPSSIPVTRPLSLLAIDYVSGVVRGELPFIDLEWSEVRNRVGGWTATLNLHHDLATRLNVDPVRTAVYVVKDERVLFGGILWTPSGQGVETLNLAGQGFLSYYGNGETGRLIDETTTFSSNDAFDVVAWLFDVVVHGGTHGPPLNPFDLVIRRHPNIAGVPITKTFERGEGKYLRDALEELADGVFEFSVDYAWDPTTGRIVHYLDLWAPRRGIRLANVLDLEAPGVELGDWSLDGFRFADRIRSIGAGPGANPAEATAEGGPASMPLIEYALALRDEADEANLARAASQEHRRRSTLPLTLAVTITDPAVIELGQFAAGDEVTVTGPVGNYLPVDDVFRIEGYTGRARADGTETLTLQLANGNPLGAPVLGLQHYTDRELERIVRRLTRVERHVETT